jgi:hypothetical protein
MRMLALLRGALTLAFLNFNVATLKSTLSGPGVSLAIPNGLICRDRTRNIKNSC